MIVGYIKEKNKSLKFLDRLKSIEITNYNNNYIISIYKNLNKENNKNMSKIIKRIIKLLKTYQIDTIVFSNEVTKEFKEEFSKNLIINKFNITTLKGKRIMKYMDLEILNYIFEKQNIEKKNEEIYILIQQNKNYNINYKSFLNELKEYIKKYIYKFKIVNLISNDIRELKNIQDEIMEKENILISVSNNKRKALKRAKYILNINLNESELQKYTINRNAIIINLEQYIIFNKTSFNGININNIELDIPDDYIEQFEEIGENFNYTVLYESIILNLNGEKSKNKVKERIKEDNIKIKYLIGNNGKISDVELKQMVKNNIGILDKKQKVV
jgi:hypothetical protein